MELSLQQVLSLRQAQENWNRTTACYLEMYRKIIKKSYTTEIRNLLNGECKILDVELDIPQLEDPVPQEDYTMPMPDLHKLEELCEATLTGASLL